MQLLQVMCFVQCTIVIELAVVNRELALLVILSLSTLFTKILENIKQQIINTNLLKNIWTIDITYRVSNNVAEKIRSSWIFKIVYKNIKINTLKYEVIT